MLCLRVLKIYASFFVGSFERASQMMEELEASPGNVTDILESLSSGEREIMEAVVDLRDMMDTAMESPECNSNISSLNDAECNIRKRSS